MLILIRRKENFVASDDQRKTVFQGYVLAHYCDMLRFPTHLVFNHNIFQAHYPFIQESTAILTKELYVYSVFKEPEEVSMNTLWSW